MGLRPGYNHGIRGFVSSQREAMSTLKFVRAPCPICGSTGTRDMGRPRISQAVRGTDLALAVDDVRILQCRQCRFYYCSPQVDFTAESMASLYDDEYFGEPSGWYERCRRLAHPENLLQTLPSLLSPPEPRLDCLWRRSPSYPDLPHPSGAP